MRRILFLVSLAAGLAAGPRLAAQSPPAARPATDGFAAAEAEAARIAQAARLTPSQSPERQRAAAELAKVVERAFDARHAAERAAVERQAAELNRAAARLQQRQKSKADIVARRVRELLSDRSQAWDDDSDDDPVQVGQQYYYQPVTSYRLRAYSGPATPAAPPVAPAVPAAPITLDAPAPVSHPSEAAPERPNVPDDLVALTIGTKSDQDKARVRRLLQTRRKLVAIQLEEARPLLKVQKDLFEKGGLESEFNVRAASSRVRQLEVILAAYEDALRDLDAPAKAPAK